MRGVVWCMCLVDAWEKCYPGSKSLQATLAEKLGGHFEEACLLLLKDPLAAWCEKLQAVRTVKSVIACIAPYALCVCVFRLINNLGPSLSSFCCHLSISLTAT
jgi:hypothetical protein